MSAKAGATPRLFWHIQNADDEADIDVFDVLGYDSWFDEGIKSADFVKAVRNLTASKIRVHINSPGGYVDDALAMYHALREHPAQVTSMIEGQAASAASFLAMAGDQVLVAKNASLMIHDALAWPWEALNAASARSLAEVLDQHSENIASIYAEKAGGSVDDWRQAMQANGTMGTTYIGQKAIDAGLADGLIPVAERRDVAAIRRMAILNLRPRSAGRAMSQKNLDQMHGAMQQMNALHDSTCDMGGDCPMDGQDGDGDENRAAARSRTTAKMVPYADHGKAPEGETWEAPNLSDFTDSQWADLSEAERIRIGNHYASSDNWPPTSFGDLHLPHHKAQKSGVGPAVKAGVDNAMARHGTHTDGVPHLEKHQADFNEDDTQDNSPALLRGLAASLEVARSPAATFSRRFAEARKEAV